jgi:hypothetical protein
MERWQPARRLPPILTSRPAAAGQGVALAPRSLIEADLAAGPRKAVPASLMVGVGRPPSARTGAQDPVADLVQLAGLSVGELVDEEPETDPAG